jgi:hypothetical protein
MNVHGAHMTPEQQRGPEPVPQALPPPDGDNLFRAIDRTRVQFRPRHLHLQARFQVLGRTGDEAHGLAREESRDLVQAKSGRQYKRDPDNPNCGIRSALSPQRESMCGQTYKVTRQTKFDQIRLAGLVLARPVISPPGRPTRLHPRDSNAILRGSLLMSWSEERPSAKRELAPSGRGDIDELGVMSPAEKRR